MTPVGVIGHRSWIAQELMRLCPISVVIEKVDCADYDYSSLSCLYLLAGRARPTDEEMTAERELVARLCAVPHDRWPKRLVYVSSRAAYSSRTAYGRLKRECEEALTATFGERVLSVRPGSIFGETQDWKSTMLVPTIARDSSNTSFENPDGTTAFIHVSAVAEYLAGLATIDTFPPGVGHGWGDPWNLPGTFWMTPRQMMNLWQTWRVLRHQAEVAYWRE